MLRSPQLIEPRKKAKGKRQKAKGKRQKAKGKRQKAKERIFIFVTCSLIINTGN
jgi:hypothetical protein